MHNTLTYVPSTTIWIVTDDLEPLHLLLRRLHLNGYETKSVTTGLQTLKMVQQAIVDESLPALILLDVSLPDVDGFEVCRHINSRYESAHIPVIFVAEQNESASRVRGFDVGGIDYVIKPFVPEELHARINSHIMHHRQCEKLKVENRILINQLQSQTKRLAALTERAKLAEQQVDSLHQEKRQLLSLVNIDREPTPTPELNRLTEREMEVLKSIGENKGNQEIACLLNVTESTVRSYRSRIANKLSAQNSYDLIRIALENFGPQK